MDKSKYLTLEDIMYSGHISDDINIRYIKEEYLVQAKFALECIEVVGNTLVRGNGITCDDIEQFCAVKTSDGYLYYHSQKYAGIRVIDYEQFYCEGADILLKHGFKWDETRKECWYIVPQIKSDSVADNLGYTEDTIDTFVIREQGEIASKAWPIRRNAFSAEVAVDTYEGYRRKGYAKQVVTAWVNHQISMVRLPFYAHRVGNTQSEALAKSLGAIKFADVISYHRWE